MSKFEVESGSWGVDTLLFNGNRIASCHNVDWKERYGTIEKWLKSIQKRESKRIGKIDATMHDLKKERAERLQLLSAINKEV